MNKLLIILFALGSLSASSSSASSGRFATTKIAAQTDPSVRHLNDILILRLAEPHLMANDEIHIDILFRLGKKWTLGPTFALMGSGEHIQAGSATYNRKGFNDTTNRRQYGLKLGYYFNHVNLSSPYISIHSRYSYSEVKSDSSTTTAFRNGSGQFDSSTYGATLGYQWQAGMIKLYLGGGVQQHFTPDTIDITYPNGTIVNLDLNSSQHADFVVDGGLGLTF